MFELRSKICLVSSAVCFFALFSCEAAHGQEAEPKNFALLVGINEYRNLNNKNLKTIDDIDLMVNLLTERFRFKENEIRILSDSHPDSDADLEPTTPGIIQALSEIALDETLDKDSRIVFYFCGHGQQILDQDDDELDCLDESLVTQSHVGPKPSQNEHANLRDDSIAKWLKELADNEIGINRTLVIVDACYSGSITRDGLVSKGLETGNDPQHRRRLGDLRKQKKNSTDDDSHFFRRDEISSTNHAVIAACYCSQTAYQMRFPGNVIEGSKKIRAKNKPIPKTGSEKQAGEFDDKVYSLLTLYLYAHMHPHETYQGLERKLQAGITRHRPFKHLRGFSHYQLPNIESTEMDRYLFSERTGESLPFATYGHKPRAGEFQSNFGHLHGAQNGTKVSIHALAGPTKNSKGSKKLFAKVVDKTVATSTLRVDSEKIPDWDKSSVYGIQLEEVGFESTKPKIAARGFEKHELKRLREKLADFANWTEVEDDAFEILLVKGLNDDGHNVGQSIAKPAAIAILRNGAVLSEATTLPIEDNFENVRDLLINHWRWKFLSDLAAQSSGDIGVDVFIAPVSVKGEVTDKDWDGTLDEIAFEDPARRFLRVGDTAAVKVQFKGAKESDAAVHINIIELDASGQIKPIFPHPETPFTSNLVNPYKYREPKFLEDHLFKMTEPLGPKKWIVFATNEALDLRPIFNVSRDERTRTLSYEKAVWQRVSSNRFRNDASDSVRLVSELVAVALTGQSEPALFRSPKPNPREWEASFNVFEVLDGK